MVCLIKILFKLKIFMFLFNKCFVLGDLNCSGNFIIWTSKCIDFNSDAKSFDDAEKECSQKYDNTHLYSIHSRIENILGLLANYNTNITHFEDAWIGLSLEYGELKWSDREKIDYSNWDLKDANHSLKLNQKYCISFNLTDGTWQPQNCLEKKPFFCGILWDSNPNTTQPTMIPPTFCNNPCFQGNCIFHQECFGCSALYTSLNTFFTAESECSSKGGHLLSFQNEAQNNDIYTFFDQINFFSSNAEAWIGMIVATNASGYGILSWTDGTLVMYNNLPLNLTLDANKTYCVSFDFLEKFWKVSDCNEKKLFLCSIPNSTVTTVPFISSSVTSMLTSANSSIKPSSNTVSTTFVTSTSTSLTPPTAPQFFATSIIPTILTTDNITTPSMQLEMTTNVFTLLSLPTTAASQTTSPNSASIKLWQILLGISIFLFIISAIIGFYIYKRLT